MLLQYIDVLVFVEATIYQMDEDNEALARQGSVAAGHRLQGGLLLAILSDDVLPWKQSCTKDSSPTLEM